MTKFESIIEDFVMALDRLDEVLREKKTDIVRDSAIKRFEILFDLAWKTIKAYLEEVHNKSCVSPRDCLRGAFKVGLIDHDEGWLKIAKDRNYTAHTYSEVLAEKIYNDLSGFLKLFRELSESLKK